MWLASLSILRSSNNISSAYGTQEASNFSVQSPDLVVQSGIERDACGIQGPPRCTSMLASAAAMSYHRPHILYGLLLTFAIPCEKDRGGTSTFHTKHSTVAGLAFRSWPPGLQGSQKQDRMAALA